MSKPSLFALLIGGRHPRGTIELHDVQFVVADDLEATFPVLRARWWGTPGSLHLDAYAKLDVVDGYAIEPVPLEQASPSDLSLFFVNVGGYEEGVFAEMHDYSFHVGRDKRQVWADAKSRVNFGEQHQDDFKNIDDFIRIDDHIATQRYALTFRPVEQGAASPSIVATYIKMQE